ncbi:DNA/RNA helicase, superfamily II [Methylophilaceae bacterium 11]|jgi:ATP-dependent RNA helicase RhlE|uniref:DEAD/DEAH box helicase n=1 Tax=Methylotenera sp. N17 TaxID=1502761 RepID=UPI0004486B02|nr:DEAD/DEAH box helicase [Methylotenera sp. N17]EUJ10811.1 DNA/RNA helicase, superfamily II [Methylophilaceae bacterium 11]
MNTPNTTLSQVNGQDTPLQFDQLGLAAPILRAIQEAGYTTPTPIQAKAIPQVLNGGDLLAGAQTGTGKTAGFTLPILHILSQTPASNPAKSKPRCLMLTPTRELAAQIEESVQTYGKYLHLKSMVVFGGVSINPQINRLSRGIDILVATPGRLLDLANQKAVDLSGVEILVLDEADRMLDMGFIHDIKKILAMLPKKRQNLLFSATFSDEIKRLADNLLNSPAFVEVARRNTASEMVTQTVHLVKQAHKSALVSYLIKQNNWEQVLIFTRTKHGANRLAEKLVKDGIPAAAIHGNKSQGARTKALADFKNGNIPALVATDIAARGLDIDQLPQVVNFELPNVPEDYVHRIGRTGRAGSTGAAISLVDFEESKYLKDIEKLIKREIPKVTVEGFEPPAKLEPEAPRPPRPAQGRRPQSNGQKPANARNAGQGQQKNTNQSHKQGQAKPKSQNQPQGQAMPHGRLISEAAKHQAMPQTPLFAPKPVHRGGNRGR